VSASSDIQNLIDLCYRSAPLAGRLPLPVESIGQPFIELGALASAAGSSLPLEATSELKNMVTYIGKWFSIFTGELGLSTGRRNKAKDPEEIESLCLAFWALCDSFDSYPSSNNKNMKSEASDADAAWREYSHLGAMKLGCPCLLFEVYFLEHSL